MACTVIEYPQSMLNTGLFKPFSHVDFNQMRNLDNKSGKAAPDPDQVDGAVESLAKVIVKYQMHDLLGITLVHNHFSLAQGEVVATHVDPKNNLVIRSCMDGELEQKEQWPVFSLGVAKISDTNKQQIPYMWALDPAANTFFTMQFFDGSYTKIADRFEQVGSFRNHCHSNITCVLVGSTRESGSIPRGIHYRDEETEHGERPGSFPALSRSGAVRQ